MKKLLIAVAACGAVALQAWAEGEWDKILDASRPEGLVIYDVGDYVQDGLVSHFDGIRNAGANLPHDDAAETWVNLVAGEINATFYRWNNDANSKWIANGYDFWASRADMASPGVALGTQFTIQIASTVDYKKQFFGVEAYPNFFSAPNDFCIYYNNKVKSEPSTYMFWKTEPYGAPDGAQSRAQGNYAEGRYITAIMDADKQRLFFGTDKNVGFIKDRTASESVPATQWRFGGGGSQSRSLRGIIHSVRLYNRALTNEELAHNRKIDDARFRGLHAVAVTGLVQTVNSAVKGIGAGDALYILRNGSVTVTAPATVEQVLDIDIAKQTQDFPNYAATYNDCGIFTRKTSQTALQWKNDYACGPDYTTRPTMQNWKGSNIVAVATTDKTYLFQDTTYANGKARQRFNDFGANRWSVGAAAGNYAESRYSIGLYFATRIYNRALSEAELAHNRKVDDVRFRGAMVTNVVVASAHDEAHGTEANGVYEVDGSWTFTAAPTVLASGKKVRPSGYSIETLTPGGWSAPVKHVG